MTRKNLNPILNKEELKELSKNKKSSEMKPYVMWWYELLKEDAIIGKHIASAQLPSKDGMKMSESQKASKIAGKIAAGVIGIGWRTYKETKGLIMLKDFPIELIRIEDDQENLAKVFFYYPIKKEIAPEWADICMRANLEKLTVMSVQGQWKGIITKKFKGVKVFAPDFSETLKERILNDEKLIEMLTNWVFGVVFDGKLIWLEPFENIINFTLLPQPTEKYLEIETKVFRSYPPNEEERECQQKIFRSLVCSASRIAEYLEPALSSPPKSRLEA